MNNKKLTILEEWDGVRFSLDLMHWSILSLSLERLSQDVKKFPEMFQKVVKVS